MDHIDIVDWRLVDDGEGNLYEVETTSGRWHCKLWACGNFVSDWMDEYEVPQ